MMMGERERERNQEKKKTKKSVSGLFVSFGRTRSERQQHLSNTVLPHSIRDYFIFLCSASGREREEKREREKRVSGERA